VKAHSAWFTLATALLIVCAANVAVILMHAHLGLGAELGLEMLIVGVGFAIPIGLTVAVLWPDLKIIFSIISDGPARATPILLAFVREELKLLEGRIADTRTTGIDLKGSTVTPWVRSRCFGVASGPYRTTDGLVPSKFLETYSHYLRTHAEYLKRTSCTTSCRINVAAPAELAIDSREHPETWAEYQRWHDDNGVALLYLDNARARELARETQLGDTVDIAMWVGELVLLVEDRDSGATNLRLALVGEVLYRRCVTYLRQVQDEAKPLSDHAFERPANTPAFY
jgi:hypothetical protein